MLRIKGRRCYSACFDIRIVEVLPDCGPDVLSQATDMFLWNSMGGVLDKLMVIGANDEKSEGWVMTPCYSRLVMGVIIKQWNE